MSEADRELLEEFRAERDGPLGHLLCIRATRDTPILERLEQLSPTFISFCEYDEE